jgi:hypothetical protein
MTKPTTTKPTNTKPVMPAADTVDQAITDVQAQLGRVDTKASILFGLTLATLTGCFAVGSKLHWHGFAVAAAAVTVCLIGAALVMLGTAIRPALRGNYGFMRWATAPTVEDLHGQLLETDPDEARLEQLWLMARSAKHKYQRVSRAVDFLGAALASAPITAILAALGW